MIVISWKPFFLGLCIVALLHPRADAATAPGRLRTFLNRRCVSCHEGKNAEGDLDLQKISVDLNQSGNLTRWARIFDRVRDHEMPPADSDDVQPQERADFLKSSESWLREHQLADWRREGRVRGRRLTNLQLERTLHDQLGIDIPLASRMPEEPQADGFTTVAAGQTMSHFQLEQHLQIVDLALDEAFKRAVEGDKLQKKTFDGAGLSRSNPKRRTREPELIDGHAVTWSSRLIFYGRLPATAAREDGWYRFTIRAKALKPPERYGVWCTVRTGRCVASAPLLSWVGAFEATKETKQWTFETWLPRGEMLEIRPGDDTLKMGRFAGGQVGTGEGGPQELPGVAIESLVMEQIDRGPSADGIRRLLFGDLEVKPGRKQSEPKLVSKQPKADLQKLMRRFAARAFRRPVADQDVAGFIELAQKSLEEGQPLLAALRVGYRALLCAPRFLYFHENPGKLDSYAVASRLSYFLWGSMPDEPLLSLAAADRLQSKEVIREQVERMLNSPRGKSFVKDFASQWLDLSEIDFTTPDRRLYPGFDVIVQESMVAETVAFLQTMLDKNQSVKRLIDSKESYLNERLARFYGIAGIAGDGLQAAAFKPEDHRGGLLTQGAIMKVTANGTNTSPVIRGVWISERLLGREIPPPPASVPAVEPDIRGAKTIREMLEKHKSDASCAACHVKIDPPGFALENFDPAGGWRDRYVAMKGQRRVPGHVVDPSYKLPDGRSFQSLEEFKELVLKNPEQIAANVAGKLLTYGTGAPVLFANRQEIDQTVKQTAEDDYGFRSIVKAVATSRSFLSK